MSQLNAAYDVQRPSGYCLATGRSLEPGEGCYSALIDIPPDQREPNDALGMKRVDVCLDAWNQGFRPAGLFSFWRTVAPDPQEKKKTFVDDAMLMNLLLRLAEESNADRLALRYVVALILMRKKLVRYDGIDRVLAGDSAGPAQEFWRMTPKADVSKGHFGKWDESQPLRVLDPKLDAEGIERVTAQLGEVLEADL